MVGSKTIQAFDTVQNSVCLVRLSLIMQRKTSKEIASSTIKSFGVKNNVPKHNINVKKKKQLKHNGNGMQQIIHTTLSPAIPPYRIVFIITSKQSTP